MSKLGVLDGFVLVSSCDFVDRLLPATEERSTKLHELTRTKLQNGEKFPSVSQYSGPVANADGSVDIYFGPLAPKGKEKNWIKTVPSKGWFTYVRFYSPTEAFFDKTWKPDDIVEVN